MKLSNNTTKRIACAALFLAWLGLVYVLPGRWSNGLAALGIVGYLVAMTSRPYERPAWGSGLVPLRPFRFTLAQTEVDHSRLLEHLKQWQATDSPPLDSRQWARLYLLLGRACGDTVRNSQAEEITVAMLHTVEHRAATAELAPKTSAWIALVTTIWTHHHGAVADAAERCLPILQARNEREQQRATLLRPAARQTDSSHLLRPPTSAPGQDPTTLLRPTRNEEQPPPPSSP